MVLVEMQVATKCRQVAVPTLHFHVLIVSLTFMAPLEYSFIYLERVPFHSFGTEGTAVDRWIFTRSVQPLVPKHVQSASYSISRI